MAFLDEHGLETLICNIKTKLNAISELDTDVKLLKEDLKPFTVTNGMLNITYTYKEERK